MNVFLHKIHEKYIHHKISEKILQTLEEHVCQEGEEGAEGTKNPEKVQVESAKHKRMAFFYGTLIPGKGYEKQDLDAF